MANIVFVYREEENLGVEYLSAVLRARGHTTALVFDAKPRQHFSARSREHYNRRADTMAERVAALQPDVVAFSTVTQDFIPFLAIAERVKQRAPCFTVFGGVHPTAVREELYTYRAIDFVAIGEGEHSLPALADALDRGDMPVVPGIGINRPGYRHPIQDPAIVADLDDLPLPDKELFYGKQRYLARVYTIMASRGCPFKCSYCFHSFWRSGPKRVRRRSIGHIIDELAYAKKRFRPAVVWFLDDNFIGRPDWTMAFCDAYKHHVGIPFKAIIHPAFASGRAIEAMRQAGCVRVNFGVQTVNEELKRTVLNRSESNDQIRRCAQALHKSGIYFSIDHLFGIPGDSTANLDVAARFYNEIRPKAILNFFLTYYPGIPLVDYARNKGLLDEHAIAEMRAGIVPDNMRGGSLTDQKEVTYYAFLFALLPALPAGLFARIIRGRWLKGLPYRFMAFLFLPRVLRALANPISRLFLLRELRKRLPGGRIG